jgi:hypothetical protein
MALYGALSEAERAVSALLAEAASAHDAAADNAPADDASLLRRMDVLAVMLQRARRLAAAPSADGSDAWQRGFASLPHAVQLRIFSFLAVDERARAAAVRRAWRDTLADASAWTQLDLSPASGLARRRATDAVLRGAAAKAAAAGGLTSLDVSRHDDKALTHGALLEVVAAHAATLRHLRCVFPPHECHGHGYVSGSQMRHDHLAAIMSAAPQLQSADFTAFAWRCMDALALLQRRGAYSRVRLHGLHMMDSSMPAELVGAALEAVACYEPPLPYLGLESVDFSTAAATEALERACARVSVLNIVECKWHSLGPAAVVRVIASCPASLTGVHIQHSGRRGPPLLDAATAALLADALRANDSITALSLTSAKLFQQPAVGLALLAALTGHPRVREINMEGNMMRDFNEDDEDAHESDRVLIGAALGALVAANAPALTFLDISYNRLGDAGLLPLFQALRANTNLRVLNCEWNTVRGAGAAALLASVRAGASGLRELRVVAEDSMGESNDGSYHPPAAAVQAEALVAERAKAGA